MKFVKTLTKNLLATIAIICILLNIGINCLNERKVDSTNNLENKETLDRRHRTRSRNHNSAATNPPISNITNITLGKVFNTFINNSMTNVDLKTFKQNNQNSKFHLMYDKQLEEIFHIFRTNKMSGVADFRSAYSLFVVNFNKCDQDKDLLINPKEFIDCMKTDPYLSLIQAPDKLFTTNPEYLANGSAFAVNLFLFADSYDKQGLNFYDYVILRIIAFAWRKCSLNAPFIDETSFECAIDIISGSRSLHSNALRKLYNLALELGNSKSQPVRNIDFIMFYNFASTIRLFGKINAKEDLDATKNEFELALDINVLPARYSQAIIDDLFKLVSSSASSKNGIDLFSFCFYDHFLKIFHQGHQSEKKWKISKREFTDITKNYLFPGYILNYMKQVPQSNYTAESYNLRAHINPSQLNEEDNLGKFLEVRSSVSNNRYNITSYSHNLVIQRIFSILDSKEEGFLSYYDFANFIQVFYLYNTLDERHADRVLIGNIHKGFTEKFDYPVYSEEFRERAKRFGMLDQDIYIDPFYTLAIVRLDDYVKQYLRKSDPTTVKEIELGMIFEKLVLKNFPSQYLTKCNRGKDDDGIPKFDWECSVLKAVSKTLKYLENARDLSDIKAHGFNLTYTAIDSAPAN
jgi:hypothetical protein